MSVKIYVKKYYIYPRRMRRGRRRRKRISYIKIKRRKANWIGLFFSFSFFFCTVHCVTII
jgi:hypothetical protein